MIRPGRVSDLPEITRIRTSVKEDHVSVAQMAAIGISEISLADWLATGGLCCWVAEDSGWLLDKGHAMARLATGPGTRAFDFYQRRGWVLAGDTSGFFAEDKVMTKRLSRA
jgi:hypothetical protein